LTDRAPRPLPLFLLTPTPSTPLKTHTPSPCSGLVAVGVLTSLAAVAAAVGARRHRWALGAAIAAAALSIIAQLALAGACLHEPERVAAAIIASDANGALAAVDAATKQRLIVDRAAAARATGAAFLVIALAQLVGLAAAACLFVRTRTPWGARYAGLGETVAGRAHRMELRGILAGAGAGGGGGRGKGPGNKE
jgi:hypothetical protein